MKELLKTPQLQDPGSELRRFQREVRCQSRLQHSGIMPILGYNFSVDPPFYIMPKAEDTLAALIDRSPNGLPMLNATEILLDIADAVDYAHQQGVYHRDLKPGNVLKVDGTWVVGDFGLCRDLATDSTTITQMNSVVGTVAYMAPEQFDSAHDITAAADVFALGRIFYHMLTGKTPFPYAPLERLPAELRYVIAKAMAEKPGDRYASVSEFAREVGLIVVRDKSLTSPSDQGGELLARALSGSTDASSQLLGLVLSNSHDEVFFTEFVARLPEPILDAFQKANPKAFADVVRAFDEYSEGGQPFNFVDVIADFFANVFRIADDPMTQALALRRIMIVGASHNRYYVGDVFAHLVSGLRDPQDVILAVNVMKADPGSAQWYRAYLERKSSLPSAIRALLNET